MRVPITRAFRIIAGGLLLSFLLTGCVERWLFIQSDPSESRVFIDSVEVGTTPARIPFDHYGTREVLVRHDPPPDATDDTGWAAASRLVEMRAPWYQWFLLDLVFEHLWPWTLVDEHRVEIVLPPLDEEKLGSRLESLRVASGADD